MAITLGNVTFDELHTTVREKFEEVGGRDERRIVISGAVVGESTVADIETELDRILDAASVEDYGAELSLRTGRRLWVRRNKFSREVSGESLIGSYALELRAQEPFEEATVPVSAGWTVTASGATRGVTSSGNVFSWPAITLVATGAVVNPSFSDGERTIAYSGIVGDGETVVFDGVAGVVTLEGVDVTAYSSGVFPRVSPEGTTLSYVDDATSTHTADVTVAYSDRWW